MSTCIYCGENPKAPEREFCIDCIENRPDAIQYLEANTSWLQVFQEAQRVDYNRLRRGAESHTVVPSVFGLNQQDYEEWIENVATTQDPDPVLNDGESIDNFAERGGMDRIVELARMLHGRGVKGFDGKNVLEMLGFWALNTLYVAEYAISQGHDPKLWRDSRFICDVMNTQRRRYGLQPIAHKTFKNYLRDAKRLMRKYGHD